MSTAETTRRFTPEDLLEMPDGDQYELVNGELVERSASNLSSYVGGETFRLVSTFAKNERLGFAWAQDCAYRCFPFDQDRVHMPDGSFVRADRMPPEEFGAAYMTVAPDLAIEVISPSDLFYKVNAKIEEYLRAGVKLVWIIDPDERTVTIHRPDGTDSRLHEDDELTGEGILPGSRCMIRDLFPSQGTGEPRA